MLRRINSSRFRIIARQGNPVAAWEGDKEEERFNHTTHSLSGFTRKRRSPRVEGLQSRLHTAITRRTAAGLVAVRQEGCNGEHRTVRACRCHMEAPCRRRRHTTPPAPSRGSTQQVSTEPWCHRLILLLRREAAVQITAGPPLVVAVGTEVGRGCFFPSSLFLLDVIIVSSLL